MSKQVQKGKFVISLDFELLWGVHDVYKKEAYAPNIYGAHRAVQQILELFTQYNIKATWAVVGILYLTSKADFFHHQPSITPQYKQIERSPYDYVNKHHIKQEENQLFFAPNLITRIEQTAQQQLASHTYAHYYCLEKGQTVESFIADLEKFQEVSNNDAITSIIFPRNQINETYLDKCKQFGFTAYRGNEAGWIYRVTEHDRRNYVKRALRFLDAYVNLFGYQTYPVSDIDCNKLYNIRGSRFLKPVSRHLSWLEKSRLRRILQSMTYAAKHGEVYHLWWHPHNFGILQKENLQFLVQILEHYQFLHKKYGFESENMESLSKKLIEVGYER